MITTIRKTIKSKTAKTILLLTAAAVGGFFSLPLFLGKSSGGQWVAKINGEEVSYNEFVRKTMEYENRIRDLRSQYGQMADTLLQSMGMPTNPRVFAANQLIGEALIDQVVNQLSLQIHSDYIQQMLNNQSFVMRELSDLIPAELVDPQSGIKMDVLKAYLPRIGLSFAEFEQKIAERLKRGLVINVLQGVNYVPEMSVRARYGQEYLGKKFSILSFDLKTYVEAVKKTPVTAEQLKRYYDAHGKRYFVSERRAGKVLEFDAKSYGTTVEEAEIEIFYNSNKQRLFVESPVKLEVRHIVLKAGDTTSMVATQEKARALRDELLKNPSLFEAKAKELSQDKESAKNGGLLPAFSRGKHAADFEKTAFLLKKDGDISDVIQTEQGLEIIQRVHRTDAVVKQLASVKAEIITKLEAKKFKDQFYKDMKGYLRDETVDSAERTKLFGMAKSTRMVEPVEKSEAKLNKTLFRLQEGDYDFYVDGEAGYVVQLSSVQKGFLPPLAAVQDIVTKDFYEQEAGVALTKALEKAKKEAGSKSFAELAAIYKAHLETTGMIKFNDAEATKTLRKQNYPVDVLQSLDKVGAVGMERAETEGYLCKLDEVESFNQKEFDEKKEEIRKGLQTEASSLTLQAFVAFLHRNATIDVNKSIVNLEE